MKNLWITAAFVAAFAAQSFGQSVVSAPEAVKTAFAKKYPDIKTVKWEQETTGWEAEFRMNGVEYAADFDQNGKWLETEHDIKHSEIPADIKAMIDKDYAGFRIDKAEMHETPAGKGYEIELEKGEQEVTMLIDAKGNITKKLD